MDREGLCQLSLIPGQLEWGRWLRRVRGTHSSVGKPVSRAEDVVNITGVCRGPAEAPAWKHEKTWPEVAWIEREWSGVCRSQWLVTHSSNSVFFFLNATFIFIFIFFSSFSQCSKQHFFFFLELLRIAYLPNAKWAFMLGKPRSPFGGGHLTSTAPYPCSSLVRRGGHLTTWSQVHTCGSRLLTIAGRRVKGEECTAANRLLLAVTHPAV